MREGKLPSRDGEETNIDYNGDSKKIIIDINGQIEELSTIEAVAFAGKLLAMVEVVLTNEHK
jgi:hypothetical protein